MNVFVFLITGRPSKRIQPCVSPFFILPFICIWLLRAGKWQSEWSLDFQETGDEGNLEGSISLKVHYFEDGNVQLESRKKFERPIKLLVSFTSG